MLKPILYFFLSFLAASLSAAEQKLALKQVVLYGIEHSPRMAGLQGSRDNARLNFENTRARFLPKLEADAGAYLNYTTSPEFGSKGPSDNRTVGLTLSQSLWDGGLKSLASDAAKKRVDAAELEYSQGRDQLVLDIVRAFYDFSEASLATQSHLEHQKMLEKQARDMDAAFRQGMLIKRDNVRMRTELQRQELIVIGARDQANRAKEQLLNLMGALGQGMEFDFESVIPKERSTDLSAVLVAGGAKLELADTSLAKRQKLEDDIAGIALESERRSKKWPTIDLSLGSSYRMNDAGANGRPRVLTRDGVNWSAGIGLRYTIWDWNIRERELGIFVNDQKKASAERAIAMAEMQQKITDIKRILGQSEKNLQLNTELLKLEEESNTTILSDFRQGKVSFLEVVDATQKLREAKLAHAKSYFDWQRNAWSFKYYVGGVFDVIQSL